MLCVLNKLIVFKPLSSNYRKLVDHVRLLPSDHSAVGQVKAS